MRLLLLIIFILTSIVSCGQNKRLLIGIKETGICLGNSKTNYGLRFNVHDRHVEKLWGINVSGISESKTTNGFTFGLIANFDSKSNGILINGLVGESDISNGIVISGLGHVAKKMNGIGIGGLAIAGDTLNGFFISPLAISYWNTEKIKRINGIAIGLILGSNTEKMNGISLSLLHNACDTLNGIAISAVNTTQELHGMQFGLWNVAENNRVLKRMPILNFNFRRKHNR